jgi:hypothetical protein
MEEKSGTLDMLGERLGPAAPMVVTVLCCIVLLVFSWAVTLMLSFAYVPDVVGLRDFLLSNMAYIAGFILFISYSNYFVKKNAKASVILPPLMFSITAFFLMYLLAGTMALVPMLSEGLGGTVVSLLNNSMVSVALLILLGGYLVVLVPRVMRGSIWDGQKPSAKAQTPSPAIPATQSPPSIEEQRSALRKTLRAAERKYLSRAIDKETFEKMAREYHAKLTELEAKEE